jgi:hypothetical protein
MPAGPDFDDAEHTRAQLAGIDAVDEGLAADARSWAAQLHTIIALAQRSAACPDPMDARFLVMELAGAWRISQLTAGRWVTDAERIGQALPITLQLLEQGRLYRHQAAVLLHRTRSCDAAIARAVEAELLPDAATLSPSDLAKAVDRAVLRLSSEQDPDAAEQRHQDAAAQRRTFSYPEADGMAVAAAVLTAEQHVGWSAAMDALQRRERTADRAAGIERTADQRRADIFAALPAMVLAGTAQDDTARSDPDGRAGQPLRPWTLDPSSSPRPSCSTCTSRWRPCSTCPGNPAPWSATDRSAPSTSGCYAPGCTGGSWSTATAAGRSPRTTTPPPSIPTPTASPSSSGRCCDPRSSPTPTNPSTTPPPGWPA